jgi:hypothetical protein
MKSGARLTSLSKRRTAIAIAGCGLLVVVVWLAWIGWDRARPETVDSLVGRDTNHAPSKLAAPGPTTPVPADSVELCGYGITQPIRDTSDYPPQLINTAERTLTRVADDLIAQPQAKLHAVGLYAKLIIAMRRAGDEDRTRYPDCADEPCTQRRAKAARQAAEPHAQRLAQLALTTKEPIAYAIALFGCRLNRSDGACSQLSNASWAQLEPSNAVPWLYLADDAAAQKDEDAMSAALLRAARAEISDYHWSTVLAMAQRPAARELPAAPRLVYLSQLLGIYAALPAPPYVAVSQACAAERLSDPARSQLCVDLATMLTERSKSVVELSLGTAIGEQAGWSTDRVRRLHDEKEAILFVGQLDWVPEDVHSCHFLEQLEARTEELLTVGELPSARQRMAASDKSVAVLAQSWRDLQRQRASASSESTRPK